MAIVSAAAARFPDQASGFFLQGGDPRELYQISVTPVYVQSASSQEQELLDVLVAGFRVDALVAQQLKQATGSEFLFLAQDAVVASTLNARATAVVKNRLAKAHGSPTDERRGHGLCLVRHSPCWILPASRSARSHSALVRGGATPDGGPLHQHPPLWLGAMIAGLGLSYLLARRIVEPVKEMDRAAAEVARQNYAIEVRVSSQDEIGRLARTFNTMCASIRQARENLIHQERISTIGRLSASIVHDLRNPLAAIYGGAEMLVDAELPPLHVRRLAGNIYRASRRIQELLQDLLDVSRTKTGPPELCRLKDVAAAACDSLAATAEAQRVTVVNRHPGGYRNPARANRMERAFVNLIGNSLEAMPEGGEVRISAVLDGGSVVVCVEDNGPGIAPEIRARLFQPFVTAGKRNGMGLGLALTRQTVAEHGGEMWVESEPGRGARFAFRLPGARL